MFKVVSLYKYVHFNYMTCFVLHFRNITIIFARNNNVDHVYNSA